jgi:putative transposase
MSHSYSSNRIHLTFSTKNREKRISEELQTKFWPTWPGLPCNHGFEAIKVGGVEDHAHALLLLLPALPFAKAVQVLKSCSSKGSTIQKLRVGTSRGRKDTVPSA